MRLSAGVAQLVEHAICNRAAVGSSPTSGSSNGMQAQAKLPNVTAEAVPRAGLPVGVELFPLEMHPDTRGCLTEIFRAEWDTGVSPVQWNVVSSQAGVLRGV